jgi:hypothetical protein
MSINDPYKKIRKLKETMEKIEDEISIINHYIQITPEEKAFRP